MGGQRLYVDYTQYVPPSVDAAAAVPLTSDWVCDRCTAVNFARWGPERPGFIDRLPPTTTMI